jgi:hypothetical protein
MKRFSLLFFVLVACLTQNVRAFWWPGGTMSVGVTAYGNEEFAGYVPSSPWGSSNFTNDPVVELRNSSGSVVGQYVLSGGAGDWYSGGSRSGTASFSAPAGNYSIGGRSGRKLQLISGEGWSGFSLNFGGIADPIPPNSPPSAAISGSTALLVGQTGTWTFSASDSDGNLAAWRFYASTNPGAGWSPISGGAAGPASYSTSFAAPGNYTWIIDARDTTGAGSSASITVSVTTPPPPNTAPSIAWNTSPGTVASGQAYTVSAHGHDADGNLTSVTVWKNGSAFGSSGGGNGTDADAGSGTSDVGPQTVTFTARATDASGATSATISQTVTVSAPPPPNAAPTIAWNTSPGTVASGQSYNVSAHGHDQDGNLQTVSVWKNGAPFAAGSGNGSDADVGNAISDSGPQTITFTAQATDAKGATSATIAQTVTVSAPPPVNRAPSVALSGSTALLVGEMGSWTFSASDPDANLSSWRFYASTNPGAGWTTIAGAAAGPGNYASSFNSPGTYTWVLEARDTGGLSAATSLNVLVTAPPSVTAALTASPTTTTAPGSTTLTWSTTAATTVSVTGPGLNATTTNASQVVSGLGPGSYTWTLVAQGYGGPITRTASVTVSAPPPSVSGSISANPTNGTEPLTTSITWSTANATAVAVNGPGLASTLANGSQTLAGLTAGTYTYTLTAQGNGGPITRTATVTVAGAPVFALTTAASGGGTVTPGGSYPAGTIVTVSAIPDPASRFASWTGDATGTQPTVAVTIDQTKYVQANFTGKAAQSITFPSPGDHAATAGPFPLTATASSGLPITFAVVSGPAIWSAGNLQLTGPGPVTLQAAQPGDAFYLPATPVNQTFNSLAPVALKYRPGARTLYESDTTGEAAPLVIEIP